MATRVVVDHQALEQLLASPAGDIARDLAERAIAVEAAAKRLCPVDTGRLRASITWAIEHDEQGILAVVGTNVHYAPHVEFGTRFMRAQPFLRPALGAARR